MPKRLKVKRTEAEVKQCYLFLNHFFIIFREETKLRRYSRLKLPKIIFKVVPTSEYWNDRFVSNNQESVYGRLSYGETYWWKLKQKRNLSVWLTLRVNAYRLHTRRNYCFDCIYIMIRWRVSCVMCVIFIAEYGFSVRFVLIARCKYCDWQNLSISHFSWIPMCEQSNALSLPDYRMSIKRNCCQHIIEKKINQLPNWLNERTIWAFQIFNCSFFD